MPSDSIYLVTDAGELQRVEHQLYASEELLQRLVSDYPELLPGEQIDPENPPRWLLLKQEAVIPDSVDSTGRWWIDHMLVDQFGLPAFVEVKRSTDTRIRREVVGQMLDYIANASAYWAPGRLRQMLVDHTGSSDGADSQVAKLLDLQIGPEASEHIERFWQKVESNLREGNVRLLFIADELPKELRRLIEFLNQQFSKIEVLGIELRQYVGQGLRALVPRVVGQTETARERKERSDTELARSSKRTTSETFLASMDESSASFFDSVLRAAGSFGYQTRWGLKGFSLALATGKGPTSVFYGFPAGVSKGAPVFEVYLAYLEGADARNELASLFSAIPAFHTVSDKTLRLTLAPGEPADPKPVVQAMEAFAKHVAEKA